MRNGIVGNPCNIPRGEEMSFRTFWSVYGWLFPVLFVIAIGVEIVLVWRRIK